MAKIASRDGELISEQLKDSSIVLINKVDLVDDIELAQARKGVLSYTNCIEIIPISAKEKLPDIFWGNLINELEKSDG